MLDNGKNPASSIQCSHCLLPVARPEAVFDGEGAERKPFCCTGCMGIYTLINDEGLDSFYSRRQGWTSGPAEQVEVDPDFFADKVEQQSDGTKALSFQVGGIRCASCIWLIEKAVQKIDGVVQCRLNYATHQAKIIWNPTKTNFPTFLSQIQRYGYRPQLTGSGDPGAIEARDLLIRFGTSAFLSMQLMIYSMALYAGYFHGMDSRMRMILQIVAGVVATPVIFFGGRPFLRGALRSLKAVHFSMDFLIVMGAGAAYFLSIYQTIMGGETYYDTAVMIITLILLGRLLETGARRKAAGAVQALASLAPQQVRLVGGGKKQEVERIIPVHKVVQGQRMIVLPGERIPLDGFVCAGKSEADEAMLTGEAKPVSKQIGSEVLGGTMNLFGRIEVEVTRTASETVLSQIVKSVEEAQARRAPVQAYADKLVAYFVPFVFITAILAFFYALGDQSFEGAIIRTISVLIVACPCALGLATPLAILVGSGLAAEKGILFKGGDIMEQTSKISHIVFDKTGTLTTGRMEVSKVEPLIDTVSQEELTRYASSLEAYSEHSIGKAFSRLEEKTHLFTVDDFQAVAGCGVQGVIEGKRFYLGNLRFLVEKGVQRGTFERAGGVETVVYLARGTEVLGRFFLADNVKRESAQLVQQLYREDLDLSLVSGDQYTVVAQLADQLGIKQFEAEVLPQEKATYVEARQRKGAKVGMVGDGINDAPALTVADVGIAVSKGTDIALESSDIVLMRDNVRLVHVALLLARKTFSAIKLNLFWAFGYNLVVLPAAFLGYIHPIVCAAAMALSSLCVVGNSLHLRRVVRRTQ